MSASLPEQPFSLRFGVRPSPQSRQPDDVPDSAKVKLAALIDRLRNSKYLPGAYSLGPKLYDALGRRSEGHGDMNQIRQLVHALEWWEFYDLCEELLRLARSPDQVAAKIDAVFMSEGLPYAITAAGIAWRLNRPAAEAVEMTSLLLGSPEFQGPSQQWDKARGHLARRPPDPENCIKDAVGALEGLARIISQRPSDTLGQIIKSMARNLAIHQTLANAMSNLYGYRSDEQAIAHGATAALEDLVPEAELVMHWCAAAMAYLVKKWRQSQST